MREQTKAWRLVKRSPDGTWVSVYQVAQLTYARAMEINDDLASRSSSKRWERHPASDAHPKT